MALPKRLFELMPVRADTVAMFPITPLAPIVVSQLTRRAVIGAHAGDHASGVLRKVPPKPGVRTSRIGRSGDVRST